MMWRYNETSTMFKKLLLPFVVAPFLFGCGGGGAGGSAHIRGLNANPALSSATLQFGNTFVMDGTAFSNVTGYSSVPSGAQFATLTDDTGAVLADTDFSVDKDAYYTAYAMRNGSGTDLVLLGEDHSTPASGQGRTAVVNASPSAGTVDVYVTNTTVTDISAVSPTISALSYESAQNLTVTAGTYTVWFTPRGSKTATATFGLSVADGGRARLVLTDAAGGGTPLKVLGFTDSNS